MPEASDAPPPSPQPLSLADVYRALQSRLDNYRQMIGGIMAAVLAVFAVLLGAVFRAGLEHVEIPALVAAACLISVVGWYARRLISRHMQPHFREMAGIVQRLELLSGLYEARYAMPRLTQDDKFRELDPQSLGPLLPHHWGESRVIHDAAGNKRPEGWADPFIAASAGIVGWATVLAMLVLLLAAAGRCILSPRPAQHTSPVAPVTAPPGPGGASMPGPSSAPTPSRAESGRSQVPSNAPSGNMQPPAAQTPPPSPPPRQGQP